MSALWEMLQRLLALTCSSAKTGVPELATMLDDGYVPQGGAAANSLARRLPGCVADEFMELFKTASSRVSSTMGPRTLRKPELRGSGRHRTRASGATASSDAASSGCYSGRTDFRVGWLWLVRQAGLAQAIEQVLGIRGALEGEEPRAFVYRPLGIGSQDLRGLSAGLVEPSELGIGSCQAEVAEAHVRRARAHSRDGASACECCSST